MDVSTKRVVKDESGMEYIKVVDEEGNVSTYRGYGDYKFHAFRFPADVPGKLKEIEKMPCREDDILLTLYPKSGTHWLTNIVSMLVNNNTQIVGTAPVIEFNEATQLKEMESPRILTSYLPFECLPKGYKDGVGRLIYLSRSPKDVISSFYYYLKNANPHAASYVGNWEGFLNFFLKSEVAYGGWFDHIKMWGPALRSYPDVNVLFLTFDDMKQNLYRNIVDIATCLGINRSELVYKNIADSCTFENMRHHANNARIEEAWQRQWASMFKDGVFPIYRKGISGDWKNIFTVAQNELFDAIYDQEMHDIDISTVYEDRRK